MSRPQKRTVDYFQHDCVPKKTLYILEERYKNDGYAFWFKLLEILGSSDGHFLDINNQANMEFLTSKTRINSTLCRNILDLLARLDAIDGELWRKGVIWSQNFVDRIAHLYAKRKSEVPTRPALQRLPTSKKPVKKNKPPKEGVSDTGNPS